MKFIVLATMLFSFTQAFGAAVSLGNGTYTCDAVDEANEGDQAKVSFEVTDSGVVMTLHPFGPAEYRFSDDWQQGPVAGMYQARRFSSLIIIKTDIDDSANDNGDLNFGQIILKKTSEGFSFEWALKIIETHNAEDRFDALYTGTCTL